MMEVNFVGKAEVNEQDIAYLLCTGFEGGVGYWCQIVGYEKPEKIFEWNTFASDGYVYKYVQYPMSEGGAVLLKDTESDDQWRLDLEGIRKGLSVMASKYPRHWENFVKDQYDADTGDVFIQCCVLGEVVFG